MTQAELTQHLDMSERNLRTILKTLDMPSRNPDIDTVRVAYIRHLRAQAARHPPPDSGGLNLTQKRAKLARVQRERQELALQKLRGELLDAKEVKQVAFSTARTVRDRLLCLPSRMVAMVTSMTSIREIELLISQEIRAALVSLAGGENVPPSKRI